MHRTLAVFVKQPRPGAVKTRLAAALGPEMAAEVYRVLAGEVLRATTPMAGEYERLVFYDPPDAGDAIRAWLPAGRLRRQASGDLGRRLSDAFARCFARGASRVAVAGSDVAGLGRGDVLAAFAALDEKDVVLGPARDGGYYLLALRSPQPALFDGVPWSSPAVLAATRERAARAGLTVGESRPLRDVDTVEDLAQEWPSLEASFRRADPRLAARVARLLGDSAPFAAVPA